MPSASSSSDEADSEAMFPAELDPPASVAHDQVNSIDEQSSSFTPPQSQDVGEAMDTSAAQANHSAPESWSNMSRQNLGEEAWVPQSEFARSAADAQFEPGAGWNNKKAREEYQRAMAVIEDKSFSLSKMQCASKDMLPY